LAQLDPVKTRVNLQPDQLRVKSSQNLSKKLTDLKIKKKNCSKQRCFDLLLKK
jgi:hypothetical protein